MDREKRKGQNPESRGSRGVACLVEEHMCDIIEVMEDTEFNGSIWIRVPGERGKKGFSLGSIYAPPEAKRMTGDIQRRFGKMAALVQKYKGQREVVFVGALNVRVGRAGRPDDIIGQCGEDNSTIGVGMLKFLENHDMKTLKDRSLEPGVRRTWTRKCKDERELSF